MSAAGSRRRADPQPSQPSRAVLPEQTLRRLAHLCGMFGSQHVGERANAAVLADRLLRENGLTWATLFGLDPAPVTVSVQIAFCLANAAELSEWERAFVLNLSRRCVPPSEKQRAVLDDIYTAVQQKAAGT